VDEALRFRRTTRGSRAKQKCKHRHVIVCLWYKLEICSGPPLSPSALVRGKSDDAACGDIPSQRGGAYRVCRALCSSAVCGAKTCRRAGGHFVIPAVGMQIVGNRWTGSSQPLRRCEQARSFSHAGQWVGTG